MESSQTFNFELRPESSHPKSPRPKSPNIKSPNPNSLHPNNAGQISPVPKSPVQKSPRPKSPRPKSPRPKSPHPLNPCPDSPCPESPIPKSPRQKSLHPNSPRPESPHSKSLQNPSAEFLIRNIPLENMCKEKGQFKISNYNMAEQRLMCVWQVVELFDQTHSAAYGTARTTTVQQVTRDLCSSSRYTHYSEKVFKDNFPNPVVNFPDYVNYFKVCLRDQSVAMTVAEEELEMKAWELCNEYYALHRVSLVEGQVFKLWQIFNKLCVQESMPPVIHYNDVQWLGEKFARSAGQRWSILQDGPQTFPEFLRDMDAACFKNISMGDVDRVIETVHSWLVREICHKGWMQKRTRKQANWTSWQKRWFILKPGLLSYYTNATLSEKKGDIILNNQSTLGDLDVIRMLFKSYHYCFRITNAPFIEIDLSAEDLAAKNEWMAGIMLVIRASKCGISPSQCKLSDVRNEYRSENNGALVDTNSRLLLRSDGEEEDFDSIDGQRNSLASGFSFDTMGGISTNESGNRSSGEESKITYCKILSVIDKISEKAKTVSGNQQHFSPETFENILEEFHINLSEDHKEIMFDLIKDNHDDLPVSNFIDYIIKRLLFEQPPSDPAEQAFLSAVFASGLKICKDSKEFEEFVGCLWDRQRVHYVRLLNEELNDHDENSDDIKVITLIRQAFSREQSILGTILDSYDQRHADQLDILYRQMVMQPADLAEYLHNRWVSYPEKLPNHPDRIAQDKSLLDIVHFTDENHDEPQHSVIEDFQLKRASTEEKIGIALFPFDFNSNIVVVPATEDTLLFYKASISDAEQLQTSLIYQHDLVKFTDRKRHGSHDHIRPSYLHYQNEAILLCPLEEESGVLVLGKASESGPLHVTGFQVPIFQTIYIPKGTIYCVDNTVGYWRRVSNPRATIQQAQMLQRDTPEPSSPKSPSKLTLCTFSFEQQE